MNSSEQASTTQHSTPATPAPLDATAAADLSSSIVPADPVNTQVTHDPEAQRKIVNRLRRAHGQLGAVIQAVENEGSCRDVVQQLAAVSKALNRAGFLVVSTSLRECLTSPDGASSEQTDELEKLFLSLA